MCLSSDFYLFFYFFSRAFNATIPYWAVQPCALCTVDAWAGEIIEKYLDNKVYGYFKQYFVRYKDLKITTTSDLKTRHYDGHFSFLNIEKK